MVQQDLYEHEIKRMRHQELLKVKHLIAWKERGGWLGASSVADSNPLGNKALNQNRLVRDASPTPFFGRKCGPTAPSGVHLFRWLGRISALIYMPGVS